MSTCILIPQWLVAVGCAVIGLASSSWFVYMLEHAAKYKQNNAMEIIIVVSGIIGWGLAVLYGFPYIAPMIPCVELVI